MGKITVVKVLAASSAWGFLAWGLLSLSLCFPAFSHADEDSACAVVKIEIKQELALERQAFDAHMRIHNGLAHITLADVDIDVYFTDDAGNPITASSDPDDADTLFFIRVDAMENITDVDGAGTVAPSSAADIHWLIIPAPGASCGLDKGKLYYVGATLAYTIGREKHTTQATPDYIRVKPMPALTLDYFLPSEVYGDDAFTPEIESPVPFSLGIRVANNGRGVAKRLKIDTAQPQIVDNEQGLLIGFVIAESEVNGQPAPRSLRADFGDIEPNRSKTARWTMRCPLSGNFVAFKAALSHSDELGGERTSLIEGAHTHRLVRDVRVDLAGRDSTRDFLAKDGDVYRVYESDNRDTEVLNLAASSSLQIDGDTGRLRTPATAGFMYVRQPDPFGGEKRLKAVTRSDGKHLKPENAWLSKSRNADHTWQHFIDLFDADTSGVYTVTFDDAAGAGQPPVLQTISDQTGIVGQTISFAVEATGPDDTSIQLSAAPLPAGAGFVDQKNGTGIFAWVPATGQAGQYALTFTASDGALSASQRMRITVYPLDDADGDGMPDDWERAHFNTVARDGTGDFDGDGVSDREEYLNGTDPCIDDHPPGIPEILSPLDQTEVSILFPELVVKNGIDPDGDAVTYEFEVFSDAGLTHLVASRQEVPEGAATPSWTLGEALADNHWYYWRVRATDGSAYSIWTYGSFFVNTDNDPPAAFNISRPRDSSHVGTRRPVLAVTHASDLDQDEITYRFEVYADSGMGALLAASADIRQADDGTTSWTVASDLADNTWYFWRAVATDVHGAQRSTGLVAFYVNTANHAPQAPMIIAPADGGEMDVQEHHLVVGNAVDEDGDVLSYYFELDRGNTFDSPYLLTSGEIAEGAATTGWLVANLAENTRCFWRVKATDGAAESGWVQGSFFLNTANEAPFVPILKNPGEKAWVDTLQPTLAVNASPDPEHDPLAYRFEVYSDPELTRLVAKGESSEPQWVLSSELTDKTWYYFRAHLEDEHGASSDWMPASSFFVKADGADTQDLDVAINVITNKGRILSNLPVYVFAASGAYTGTYTFTDENGVARFVRSQFEAGIYQFRVDHLREHFWSDSVQIPGSHTVDVVIAEETVAVRATTASEPQQDIRIYLFSEDGAYLGLYGETDANGEATFELPAGVGFKFRVDILGNPYWSDVIQVAGGGINAVAVETGGGVFRVKVLETAQSPMTDVKLYLFSEKGSYLGRFQETDPSGIGAFKLPAGSYKVRADWLGYQFWSLATAVESDTNLDLFIPHVDVSVAIKGIFQGQSEPLDGIKVYLFTPSGSYLGQHQVSDANGEVVFNLPEKRYAVRADYLNQKFWSDAFVWQDATVNIPMADADVFVSGNDADLEGVKVYAFSSEGSYLGVSGTTDPNGRVKFRLPSASYKFRADYQGRHFWSAVDNLAADQVTPVTIPTGGGTFNLTLRTAENRPLEGVNCYVFTDQGSYLGLSGATSSEGEVIYGLADGRYKIRMDYLGYPFWTDVFSVPDTLDLTASLNHQDITIKVEGLMAGEAQPRSKIPVYLFSSAGAYLAVNAVTDDNGEVTFNLPEKAYNVRADYLDRQFWSGEFTWQNPVVTISEGVARVRVTSAGQDVPNIQVYLFSDADTYLGLSRTTDSNGMAEFRLPAEVYKFRADYQAEQFWARAEIAKDIANEVAIDTGGGQFVLTIDTGEGPLAGARVYGFNSAGKYLGIYGNTDASGQVSFDLSDGSYKFRVDHLGYQFWSDVYDVPTALSGVFTLPHQDVSITVEGVYQDPMPMGGLKVYLFTSSGSYQGQYRVTDENGQAVFYLPDRDYQVRADYLGQKFWSEVFRSQDTTVTINRGFADIRVHRSGSDVSGGRVYLFSDGGAYLGWYEDTDASGQAGFLLPDHSFKFRVDEGGEQHWTSVIDIMAGEVSSIEVDLDYRFPDK